MMWLAFFVIGLGVYMLFRNILIPAVVNYFTAVCRCFRGWEVWGEQLEAMWFSNCLIVMVAVVYVLIRCGVWS